MTIKKQPEQVTINMGKIRMLDSLKKDLDLYIEFIKETVGDEFRVCDVLLGCLEQEVNSNAAFKKFRTKHLTAAKVSVEETKADDKDNVHPMNRPILSAVGSS